MEPLIIGNSLNASNRSIASQDAKPYKVLLEIIFNRNKKKRSKQVPSVRMSDLLDDLSLLNDSTATTENSTKTKTTVVQTPLRRSPDANLKEKKLKIRIKIRVSSKKQNHDSEEKLTPSEDGTGIHEETFVSNTSTRASELERLNSTLSKNTLNASYDEEQMDALNVSCTSTDVQEKSNNTSIDSSASDNLLYNESKNIYEKDLSFEEPIVLLQKKEDSSFSNGKCSPSPDKNACHHSVFLTKMSRSEKYEDLSDTDDNKISAIVHQLILDKYDEVLNDFKQRSMKRQLSKKSNQSAEDSDRYEPETKLGRFLESYLDSMAVTERTNKGKSIDSGLNESEDDFLEPNLTYRLEPSQAEDKSESTVEYDAQEFLSAALGEEMMNSTTESQVNQSNYYESPIGVQPRLYTTERSIGSSNISTLISGSEYRKSDALYSLYSVVKKPSKSRHNQRRNNNIEVPMFSSTSISNDYDYESVNKFKLNPRDERLIEENALQREIIHQISKALSVCRANPDCVERNVLAEAEKILLVATFKKDIINSELNKIEYEEVDCSETSCTINIKKLKFSLKLNGDLEKNKRFDWYFLCILHCGSIVKASDVITPDADGGIIFEDGFEFKGLSDVEIIVSVFAMSLKTRANKKSKHTPIKMCTSSKKTSSKIDSPLFVHSSFMPWGTATIRPTDLTKNNKFKLSKVPIGAKISDEFAAEIESSLKINIIQKNFLTIGTNFKGCPIWNRRWCVLEGSRFRYWNYPNEETSLEPVGELDLLQCISQHVKMADRDICSRPKTLFLEMRVEKSSSAVKEYFLSADSSSDLEEWQKKINSVLGTLRKWSNVGSFFEN